VLFEGSGKNLKINFLCEEKIYKKFKFLIYLHSDRFSDFLHDLTDSE
jgi:hypothetical protein